MEITVSFLFALFGTIHVLLTAGVSLQLTQNKFSLRESNPV